MSTPNPPNSTLEDLDLYAPRGEQTVSAQGSQEPPSQTCPDIAECDAPHADSKQPRAAANETLGDTPPGDGNQTTLPSRNHESFVSKPSLPLAPKLSFRPNSVDGPTPPASNPPWLSRHIDKTTSGRLSLDPKSVTPPPNGTRPDILTPILIVSVVGCAAIIGLTMISAFQPAAHPPNRTSENILSAAPTLDKAGRDPRLVVDVEKAFANEPLSLKVSLDSATGQESLLVAGLALGTRLSAGVPISDASWQLVSSDLTGLYVYAPKNFLGVMNTAINLLSADQRLIESRAARLEWIVKANSSSPTSQLKSEAVNAPAIQAMSPENSALMGRGRDLLKSGDVGSARLVFSRLANAGIADAALALAATYDRRYLAQRNLIGVAGDDTKAHDWYQRASELGSTEAGRILARTNDD